MSYLHFSPLLIGMEMEKVDRKRIFDIPSPSLFLFPPFSPLFTLACPFKSEFPEIRMKSLHLVLTGVLRSLFTYFNDFLSSFKRVFPNLSLSLKSCVSVSREGSSRVCTDLWVVGCVCLMSSSSPPLFTFWVLSFQIEKSPWKRKATSLCLNEWAVENSREWKEREWLKRNRSTKWKRDSRVHLIQLSKTTQWRRKKRERDGLPTWNEFFFFILWFHRLTSQWNQSNTFLFSFPSVGEIENEDEMRENEFSLTSDQSRNILITLVFQSLFLPFSQFSLNSFSSLQSPTRCLLSITHTPTLYREY